MDILKAVLGNIWQKRFFFEIMLFSYALTFAVLGLYKAMPAVIKFIDRIF